MKLKPHKYKYLVGTPDVSFGILKIKKSPKNGENLMKFNVAKVRILMRLWFSRRVQKNPVYFGVHDFSGSAEKAKYRKIMTFARSWI